MPASMMRWISDGSCESMTEASAVIIRAPKSSTPGSGAGGDPGAHQALLQETGLGVGDDLPGALELLDLLLAARPLALVADRRLFAEHRPDRGQRRAAQPGHTRLDDGPDVLGLPRG